MEIKCRNNYCENNNVELHHIIPKSIGGTDKDGRKYLCKKHHDIIHKMLLKQIWGFIDIKKREKAKEKIKSFTEWFLNNYKY